MQMNGKTKPENFNTWNGKPGLRDSLIRSPLSAGSREIPPVTGSSANSRRDVMPVRLRKLVITSVSVIVLHICQAPFAAEGTSEIYKWVDEDGTVHFGDRPADNTVEKIIIKNPAGSDEEYQNQMQKQYKLLEVYGEERHEQKEQKEKKKKDQVNRQNNCKVAKKYLEDLRTAGFLYEDTDDPFNPRVLSFEERATETARAEDSVKRWCN